MTDLVVPEVHIAPLQLQVRLLGRFSVAVDGVERASEHWPSLRAMHLVQLLSPGSQRRLTREEVIEALWLQLEPEAGAANLRKAAHHARQALGRQDGVVLRGGDVTLWPDRPVVVDAARFEERARAALAGADPAACVEAAKLYSGALLPGSPYESWAEPARERLHERFIELLRAAAEPAPPSRSPHLGGKRRRRNGGGLSPALGQKDLCIELGPLLVLVEHQACVNKL